MSNDAGLHPNPALACLLAGRIPDAQGATAAQVDALAPGMRQLAAAFDCRLRFEAWNLQREIQENMLPSASSPRTLGWRSTLSLIV